MNLRNHDYNLPPGTSLQDIDDSIFPPEMQQAYDEWLEEKAEIQRKDAMSELGDKRDIRYWERLM